MISFVSLAVYNLTPSDEDLIAVSSAPALYKTASSVSGTPFIVTLLFERVSVITKFTSDAFFTYARRVVSSKSSSISNGETINPGVVSYDSFSVLFAKAVILP